ncbi:hypothetical protein ACWGNA_20335 [Brucella cytisi]|uniref:hypothetical protein n=1 Tax=Brucella cytisi TaxID=407152 RepID=UPI0035E386D1
MKGLRIYATPDGESHFDEIDLPTTKRSVRPDALPFDVTASYRYSSSHAGSRAATDGPHLQG